jgi:hypothetical protein
MHLNKSKIGSLGIALALTVILATAVTALSPSP